MTTKQVKDWMTTDVTTVPASATLPDAYWLMVEHRIRRLPVMESDKLVGIVTFGDLYHPNLSNTPGLVAGIDIVRLNMNLSQLPIHQLMTKDPKTIAPAAALIDAARLMLEHDISALPVLDGDTLVGIITECDIFRAFVASEEKA
jgi:acetoin utilization protein AcuB